MDRKLWYFLIPAGSQKTETSQQAKVLSDGLDDIDDLKNLVWRNNTRKLNGVDPGDLDVHDYDNKPCKPQQKLSDFESFGTADRPFIIFYSAASAAQGTSLSALHFYVAFRILMVSLLAGMYARSGSSSLCLSMISQIIFSMYLYFCA
jgi:hypothetical protein